MCVGANIGRRYPCSWESKDLWIQRWAFAGRGEPETDQIQQIVGHFDVETQIGYGYDEKQKDKERVSNDLAGLSQGRDVRGTMMGITRGGLVRYKRNGKDLISFGGLRNEIQSGRLKIETAEPTTKRKIQGM